MEKVKREDEFNKTNREMREIKQSLKSNQHFLLSLKADMLDKNKSHRSNSKSKRSNGSLDKSLRSVERDRQRQFYRYEDEMY
jgi:GTPase involved in cell partitioning and DNA repair